MSGREQGFTLLEMVVVLAIVGTALGAVFGMIQGMFRGMALTERTLEVQQNARGAVDRVVEELRWAEEVLPDAPCGGLCPDRISVRIAAHNPRRPGQTYVVTFQRDPLQRELERRLSGAVNNLAGSIDGLAFRYFDAGGAPTSTPQEVVRVEVTVAAGSAPPLAVSRMVATDVFLRNHPPASPVPP